MNCVEAVAACFCITGHEEWARQVLDHFSWGDAFFEVNRELLDIYASCTDAEDIGRKQEAWMEKLEQEYQDKRNDLQDKDDMWLSGNANHEIDDVVQDEEEEDESLWVTDKLGNRTRKE